MVVDVVGEEGHKNTQTSPETVKYTEEAHERSEKKEKVKKEKNEFVKKALS